MTDVDDLVTAVESDASFSQLSPSHVLAHVFCQEKQGRMEIQIGYFDALSKTITVFETAPVRKHPPDRVFQERPSPIEQLDLETTRVGLSDVRERSFALITKERPGHQVVQGIYVLQQAERPVWNVTLVTNTLRMLQIRVDATTGDATLRDETSLLDFGQKL